MAKASPIQESFSTGEVSPRLLARVNLDRYKSALEICENYIPTVQGPLERRPGTIFVGEVKDSSKFTRLVEFEFSTTQAYILEFGDEYIRFYKDYGQIVDGSSDPYEIPSPYTEEELPDLRFAQSADILFIAHPNRTPRKLIRNDHDDWDLEGIYSTNPKGPYLPVNTTATTMTPDGTSGLPGSPVTIVASSADGINDGEGFAGATPDITKSDLGRGIALKIGGTWGVGYIASVDSSVQVKVWTHGQDFGGTTATTEWRLQSWCNRHGWPSCITFHEDRLIFGGQKDFPQRFDGSNIGDYTNFEPYDADGTITDSHAYSFTLNSGDVNNIRWIKSDEKGMPIGTVGGEWIVRPSSTGESITPTNVSAKRLSHFGSAAIDAVQLGKAAIFTQRTKRKLRELTYFYEVDGFKAVDMTELATHILEGGVREIKAQKEPQPIIWAVREDGVLASMTYTREDTILAGWARHKLGGRSDVNGTHPIVESVAVIPSPDTSTYDVWLIVKRWIDGEVKRYIEYIPKFFSDEDQQEDAQFLDCALTYYDPIEVSNINLGATITVTATSHGLTDGDNIRFFDLVGGDELLNTTFVVASADTDTFTLNDSDGNAVDGSLFTAYVSGGEIRKLVSTISGLDHLEGEQVSVFADGAVQADRTVSSGSITLQYPATKVHIGLNYISRGKTVRYDIGAEDGTALGKTRRIHNVSFYVHRSMNLKIGTDFNNLDRISFSTSNDDLSQTPELFSGIYFNTLEADYDTENQICFEQDKPLPSTILAIMPQLHTQDR